MAKKKKEIDALTKDSIKARELGLTYGQYKGYEHIGCLESYKRQKFRDMSHRRADGMNTYFDSTVMEDIF